VESVNPRRTQWRNEARAQRAEKKQQESALAFPGVLAFFLEQVLRASTARARIRFATAGE
jgi:uncharacterized MAPEG superfamily protein